MPRYDSSRHRRLMDVSEAALEDATRSDAARDARIATNILGDSGKYRLWESRHADMLVPVAAESRKKPQVVALRRAKVQLVHRRALFRYLRMHKVQGQKRRDLFRLFHATVDYNDAVLAEHRQYMVAVSSRISTDRIIDVMQDGNSTELLERYEDAFARYFEMKCFIACARNESTVPLVQQTLRQVERHLLRLRRAIETAEPADSCGDFDYRELLARSGSYPIMSYLNA